MLTIHNLHLEGKTVQEIAQELKISRTTVRKYLKHPEAVIRKPRPLRPSKLDPFKEQISKWVTEDHCTNCEVIFSRLRAMGYTGGMSILKEFVHPCDRRWPDTRRCSAMRASRESRCNLTGASLSTKTRARGASSTGLRPSWAIHACALSP